MYHPGFVNRPGRRCRPQDRSASASDGPATVRDRRFTLDLGHFPAAVPRRRGSRTLELLSLFRVAGARWPRRRLAIGGRLTPSAGADIAHRLRGSALAVGARAVARAAESVEFLGRDAAGAGNVRVVEMSQAIAQLGDAVNRATAEIDALRP